MQKFKLKKGLSLPITGAPLQEIMDAPEVESVGIVASDFEGLKPTLLVKVGDRVQLGQPVFQDKKNPGVNFTAPASGLVEQINRGAKRKFESLVVRVEGNDEKTFATSTASKSVSAKEHIVGMLVESGLWTAFRTRPYGKVPRVNSMPAAIFVTAIDTDPLAPSAKFLIQKKEDAFVEGLLSLATISDNVHVCVANESDVRVLDHPHIKYHIFNGPHPAGLPSTHIHFIDPVGPNKTVWHIGYQDVSAVGNLFLEGRIDCGRFVAIGGPGVIEPKIMKTRMGARIPEVIHGQCVTGKSLRIISGSVLSGRQAIEPVDYVGRFDNQISVLEEGDFREFLGWQKPGFNQFSVTNAFASAFTKGVQFPFTTSTGGSKRAMVPIGSYEKVMPLDILATQLLRSLIVGDTEQSQKLGCLELVEEDLALCTFVCPGKYEYGRILRDNLRSIEIDG
ncbi:Na(+)-translocating NADH-quinone reductase subunit A [Pirellulales bacterium]|nr:Na(+)-translocating NADH-quinone reductase subunit A [Pirellulales bacterium]MDB4475577.1 Na(+)-translocating NADH-quinone reductase subunit A [Pirellulales bacterium]